MKEIMEWAYLLVDNSFLLYLFLFLLGVINAFFPPVPIEGLTLLGGYLAGTGHGSLILAWLTPSLGMSLGTMILFVVVRSNEKLLLRWPLIKKHLAPEQIEKSQNRFERYGVWAIFVGRLIPWMTFTLVFYSGLSKIPIYRLFPAVTLSNIFYFGGLVLIGRYAKEEWELVVGLIKPVVSWLGLVLLLIGGVTYLVWRRRRKK